MNFLLQHTAVRFFVEGLWRDEAFSWAMATRGFDAVALTARDFNPPLYYLLLYGWIGLVGSSEAALRSLSVIFFAATLWVAWCFMRDLLAIPSRRTLVYLALFALNPMLAYYASEARMYSMFAFLAAASFYAWMARRPVLYVITTAAALYTHSFAFLIVGTQLLSALTETREPVERRRRMILLGLPVLAFAPWIVVTLLNQRGAASFWVDPPGWRFGVHLVTSIYTGHDATYGFLEQRERWMFALILIPMVLWGLVAAARPSPDRGPVIRLVALWALLPPALVFAATLVKPVFVPRYLIFSTVGLLFLLILGVERTPSRVRFALLAVLCALAVLYQALQAHRHTKGAYRETLTQIARQAGPADVVYVRSELDFFPAQYYFGPSRVYIVGRKYEDIPAFMGKVLIPPASVVDGMPAPPTRVFLLKSHAEYVDLGPPVLAARRADRSAGASRRESRVGIE